MGMFALVILFLFVVVGLMKRANSVSESSLRAIAFEQTQDMQHAFRTKQIMRRARRESRNNIDEDSDIAETIRGYHADSRTISASIKGETMYQFALSLRIDAYMDAGNWELAQELVYWLDDGFIKQRILEVEPELLRMKHP